MKMGSKPVSERNYLGREELAARRGADPEDLASVEAFAHAQHLTVVEASIPRRTVRLSGTVADFQRAFGVKLQIYSSEKVNYRGRTGSVCVPSKLVGVIEGVFGLDNRPAREYRKPWIQAGVATGRASKHLATTRFSVGDLKRAYNFPSGLDGAGQSIALIELNSIDAQGNITGAGYDVSDLETYFKKLGVAMPFVSAIGVAGGINKVGVDQTGNIETTLDIQIVGAAAPAAKIAVYFAPNTDAGFVEAVSAAVHDTVRKPSVISISWGMPEENATGQFIKAMNEVLQDAAALGITVCCESGDHGSSDQPIQLRDGMPHVEFPASSPFALACGGTRLVASGATIESEIVWNEGDQISGATGGGVSNKFPRPGYQKGLKAGTQEISGRGLPDVAANALGYSTFVFGKDFHVFGTSAATPLWASLIAIINQDLQASKCNSAGFLNPLIYSSLVFKGAFHDIIEGNNDIDGKLHKYSAAAGWDPCTGIGSPDGARFLSALKSNSKPKPNKATPRQSK